MTKEEYLESLSKMDGLDLIAELADRKRAVNEEINANGRETEKCYDLVNMYYTCRNYIAETLDKEFDRRRQLPFHLAKHN